MDNLESLLRYRQKTKKRGVIVDTNLLLLLLVAAFNIDSIFDCKAITDTNKIYSKEDVELLKRIITIFGLIVVTPQVLAEISNISFSKTFKGDHFAAYMKKVIEQLQKSEEAYQHMDCLWSMDIRIVSKYGITDLNLLTLSKSTSMPILTDDLKLSKYGLSQNVPMIYFDDFKNKQYQSLFA